MHKSLHACHMGQQNYIYINKVMRMLHKHNFKNVLSKHLYINKKKNMHKSLHACHMGQQDYIYINKVIIMLHKHNFKNVLS